MTKVDWKWRYSNRIYSPPHLRRSVGRRFSGERIRLDPKNSWGGFFFFCIFINLAALRELCTRDSNGTLLKIKIHLINSHPSAVALLRGSSLKYVFPPPPRPFAGPPKFPHLSLSYLVIRKRFLPMRSPWWRSTLSVR